MLLVLQVPKSVWGSVQALKELEDYTTLPDDLVGSSKRWREWMELERPGKCGIHLQSSCFYLCVCKAMSCLCIP